MALTPHENVTTVWLPEPDSNPNDEWEREVTVAYETNLDDDGRVVTLKIVEMEENSFASGRTRTLPIEELDEEDCQLVGAVCRAHAERRLHE
jgi:hypothetical protein